nr:unnamed protein product [Callosobruchus analis]
MEELKSGSLEEPQGRVHLPRQLIDLLNRLLVCS